MNWYQIAKTAGKVQPVAPTDGTNFSNWFNSNTGNNFGVGVKKKKKEDDKPPKEPGKGNLVDVKASSTPKFTDFRPKWWLNSTEEERRIFMDEPAILAGSIPVEPKTANRTHRVYCQGCGQYHQLQDHEYVKAKADINSYRCSWCACTPKTASCKTCCRIKK